MWQVVCFHNPDEPNGYLSNWYLAKFEQRGIRFSSMEQYMMYEKAKLFHDQEAASRILQTDNVGKIKAIGREVRNYEELFWNGMRQIVVYQGLLAKFTQNAELKQQLIATGDALLAECAVQDRVWGIGLSMRDAKRFDPEAWRGKNLLGFALMQVRRTIEEETASSFHRPSV